MVWTDERVELLKKFWSEGLSASQIANRISGITRNAVIGKVHRLGLAGRPAASRPYPSRPGGRRSGGERAPFGGGESVAAANPVFRALCTLETPTEPKVACEENPDAPSSEAKSLQELRDCHCRWPVGDPQKAGFHFCGKQKVPGLPYCETHARRAYQAPAVRRRDQEGGRVRLDLTPLETPVPKSTEPAGV